MQGHFRKFLEKGIKTYAYEGTKRVWSSCLVFFFHNMRHLLIEDVWCMDFGKILHSNKLYLLIQFYTHCLEDHCILCGTYIWCVRVKCFRCVCFLFWQREDQLGLLCPRSFGMCLSSLLINQTVLPPSLPLPPHFFFPWSPLSTSCFFVSYVCFIPLIISWPIFCTVSKLIG